jgi:hypothetical protein
VTTKETNDTLLAHLHRDDFVRVVRHARTEANEADAMRATLLKWADRLLPYLDDHSDWTLQDAIDRYHAEHPGDGPGA